MEDVFDDLKARWPSSFVARKRIEDFSGGLVSAGTLANADSAGTGPDGKFYLGRNAGYCVDAVLAWMRQHISPNKLRAVDRTNRGKGKKPRRMNARSTQQ